MQKKNYTHGISSSPLYYLFPILTFPKHSSFSTISEQAIAKPVKVYEYPDVQRAQINKELKGISGIYRWINKESGKSYVGSATNFTNRLSKYFSKKYLTVSSRNMRICKGLLKYGHAGFKLEILEFCSVDILMAREQYYLDKLQPEYNILKSSGSSLGYKHTEIAKNLISEFRKNKVMADTTRELIRESLRGRVISTETIEKRRACDSSRQPIILTNIQTGEIKDFPSLTIACSFLGVTRYMINKHILNNTDCKGYKIGNIEKRQPKSNGYNATQPITLTNKETGEVLEFSSMSKAAEHLNISQQSLKKYFNGKIETIKGYKATFSSTLHKDVREWKWKQVEVINVITNEVKIYPSQTLAAKELDIKQAIVSYYIKRATLYKGTYKFKFVKD